MKLHTTKCRRAPRGAPSTASGPRRGRPTQDLPPAGRQTGACASHTGQAWSRGYRQPDTSAYSGPTLPDYPPQPPWSQPAWPVYKPANLDAPLPGYQGHVQVTPNRNLEASACQGFNPTPGSESPPAVGWRQEHSRGSSFQKRCADQDPAVHQFMQMWVRDMQRDLAKQTEIMLSTRVKDIMTHLGGLRPSY